MRVQISRPALAGIGNTLFGGISGFYGFARIPDTELCAVLSNGLENALTATEKVEDTARRTIQVTCSLNRDKLLLMIENPYQEEISMENGIPTSQQEGHGFGCRSMVAIAQKRNGHSVFKAENGEFVLRVVLPV